MEKGNNLLNTVPRETPFNTRGFFMRKNPNNPQAIFKCKIAKFKPDVKSPYFTLLNDTMATNLLLEKELTYSSQQNKARVKVIRMRLRASLSELIGVGIEIPAPMDRCVHNHLEKAISLYKIMDIRATKKLKEEFFNCLLSARKLL